MELFLIIILDISVSFFVTFCKNLSYNIAMQISRLVLVSVVLVTQTITVVQYFRGLWAAADLCREQM